MFGLLWVLESILLGCLLVYRWTCLRSLGPRWAGALLVCGTGAAGGIGLTSCTFFVLGVLLRLHWVALGLEAGILAGTALSIVRTRKMAPASDAAMPFPRLWMMAALALALGLATAAMAQAWDANPHGNWDAWGIWNLRARFLASAPELAPRAWSAELGKNTHSEYPLLVSGAVARAWTYSHSFSMVEPAAISYVFFMALVAMALGAVSALRGGSLGLLGVLALAATPTLLHEVPAEYADIPLACYMAASVLFALLDRPLLAGIFAGFAAWTKDEGLLFLAVVLLAIAVFRRGSLVRAAAGALPGGALAILFKLVLVNGHAILVAANSPGAVHRIADPSRYGAVTAGFGQAFLAMAQGWYHPILPLMALAAALRFDRQRRRDSFFCAAIAGAMLAGYFGIYIITANDLQWQMQTSLARLFVQVWPLVVLAVLVGLRAPEAARIVGEAPQPKVKARRKGKG
jgi:hypothetical protein